jgi:hypothetical protein
VKPTQIDSRSGTTATGSGGAINVRAGEISLVGGGVISASTFGVGPGGSIDVRATDALNIHGPADAPFTGIFAASRRQLTTPVSPLTGLGNAGSVAVHAGQLSVSNGGQVSVFAELSSAGSLTLDAGRALRMDAGLIDASAAVSSGRVLIRATDIVNLRASRITATTPGDGSAGLIEIDPRLVVLSHGSLINGRAGVALNDVPVRIVADALIASQDSAILTSKPEFNAAVDVTAGLLRLNGNLVDQSARLVDRCGPAVSAAARSSFTIGGRHATPIQPGGPVPDFLFEPGGAAPDRGTP